MKQLLGLASLIVALFGYFPYVRDTLVGKTKPHAFSWLVWSVLSAIAFAIQATNNGGAGAWLMGLTAIVTFSIFILSFRYGEKRILIVDWASLIFASLALWLWYITSKPLLSVILIASIDAIGGFLPTFRKSIANPHQETAALYVLYAVSLGLSLIALRDFSLVNALYPASFVLINLLMAGFLVWQRRRHSRS